MEPVYLRSLELDDLERTLKWHNDAALYETLTGTFRYVSRAAEEAWLRQKIAYAPDQVNLAVCLTSDAQHIGNIYLSNVDFLARHAELALFIGESQHRSKGYGRAAVRLLMKHAYQDLGLRRLYLFVLADNLPAIRVYEKCGFVVEGQLRQHVFKNGQLKDLLIMGACSDGSSGPQA